MSEAHISHPMIVARLKRAEGHLRSVIAMIEQDQACVDVAQQLAAVESAITNAKVEFIRDHIDNCLDAGPTRADPRALVDELKAIAKYL